MSATETRSIFPRGMPLMDAVTGPDNNNLENGRLKKKKKGRKSTVEQLWTRLFIPINSLPSRIPLHVRYFPRICIEVARYSKRAAIQNRGPVSASDPSKSRRTRRTSAGNRWRIGRGVVKTRRRTESGGERSGGMEKKGSHLGRPKTLPLPLATTRLRNS